MHEAELRAKFDREIGAPDQDLIWRWLEQRGFVEGVCSGQELWEDLEHEARLLADHQREMLRRHKPHGRTPKDRSFEVEFTGVELTDLQTEHAAALAPYLAKRAALLPEVLSFREEKLDGGTLEPEHVGAFLRRELRHLPPGGYTNLEWYPWDALVASPDLVVEEEKLKDLVGGWNNRTLASQENHYRDVVREAFELDSMAIPLDSQHPYLYGLMHLVRDKTSRTLEDVARWLLSRYPWTLRDTAWFVLTDEPPEIASLKVQRDGMLTLTFAPWISEKTIRLAYRSLQLGDNRPLGYKSLAAFRFVNENTELREKPKWAELTNRWNQRHPDDKFRDRSALRRTYLLAKERLVSPWFGFDPLSRFFRESDEA